MNVSAMSLPTSYGEVIKNFGANVGRHSRAFQAYLGHKNIQHTVRYTALSPDRFKDFWR